jgi:DNA topoisomerase-1
VVVRVAARYKNKKRVKTQDGKEMIVYEYSERQIANRNREKAKKIQALSKNIANLRKQVFRDLTSEDPKKALVALAVGLMDETYERVGNDESAKEGHYGVTGWSKKHVSFGKGKATIKYVGKSGVEQEKTVRDSALLKALRKAYDDAKDGIFSPDSGKVSASDVNAYLRTFGVTAKDIRGFHANDVMRGMLQGVRKGGLPEDKKEREQKLKEEFKQALEATAEAVGHEPATLRGQYLVPGMAEAYLKDGTILTKLDKTAAYSGSTLEQVMAGLGMLMTQSIIVTNQFFNEAEIRKFLALRKSYHEQFAEACEDLAEALEAGTFGVLAQAAAKPLQQIGGIPASQAQRALRLATRTFRGLKRIQARDLPEGADIRLLRLIRMAERLDPLNEERSYKDYAVFLDQLIRVQEIPAPVRTLLRKAWKYTQYARPDETANPGAWFEMSPETQNQFKALAEKLNQQTTEIFEQYQDPEERREKWQVNNRKLEKLRNAAGVNMDVVLQGAAGKETESIDKTLQKESKLQADGPTEYVLQQVHNVLYRSGEYAHKGEGKGVSREVRKVLTKLSKARKFDTIRRIIKEAVSQRLFGEDMTSTVDNILKGAGKNLAVQRGIPLTPLQWAPISEEDFQVKHNTGTVRFEEDLPKERREEVLGRVSRALEDLEGIFGKGFAGKHDKPLQFFFTGGGAFASASYFAYDNPATWQPRVKFGDDYEGLLAHELSHYFDDLLANKIAKIERPDAVPYMSRELFGLTGVKLDYLAGNEQWMERMRRTIPELAELAQTIVSTKDYARWKDMTSSAHEMAVGKAVQALTGQEVYDLPKDNPFAKVYWELPRYRSDWPPELLAETEKQYKAMMDGDDRKLTYYHSGVEIWARVIEQYIYTKLAKVGIANPWLTQLTYDTDVLPQAMEQETFEEKIVPILDRLFAKIKERQLIARIQARYVQAILRIPHV